MSTCDTAKILAEIGSRDLEGTYHKLLMSRAHGDSESRATPIRRFVADAATCGISRDAALTELCKTTNMCLESAYIKASSCF